MGCSIVEGTTGTTIVARRNNSLSTGGRRLVVGFLAAVVLAISLGFAFAGAWVVFPFGGLDVLLLYLAFRYMERHAGDYERVSIDGDKVVVELGQSGRCASMNSSGTGCGPNTRRPGARKAGGWYCGRMAPT